MISVVAVGLVALAALFLFRWQSLIRVIKVVVLLLAVASTVLIAETAHFGGLIRHSEISNPVTLQDGNESNLENGDNGNTDEKKDD